MIRTAASLLGMTAAFALVLYLSYSCGNDATDSLSPTATPSPTVASPTPTPRPVGAGSPTPTPIPVPTPLPDDLLPAILEGEDVRHLVVTDPIPFPDELALVMEFGCYGCDGPVGGLKRIYRDVHGVIREDVILSAQKLGLPMKTHDGPNGPYELPPHITGLAIAPDGSDMIVGFCVRASCGDGGLSEWSGDSKVALFRSVDGGVTWGEFGEEEHGLVVLGYVSDGTALVSWNEEPLGETLYALYPSMTELVPPADQHMPILARDGDVIWGHWSGGSILLRSDSTVFIDMGEDALVRALWSGLEREQIPGNLLSWQASSGSEFLSVLQPGQLGTTVALQQTAHQATWLPWGEIIAGMRPDLPGPDLPAPEDYTGLLPVIIDPVEGTLSPIGEPFLDDSYSPQRDTIRAVQIGPFARVVDTRSCLNLRTSPGLDATKVGCLADGVLLRHDSVVVTNQDVEWLQVTAPDGTPGWAATEFLEY